ncbi:plasmid replication protein RepC [Roseomonas haemaphysalidis]|uniref:Replication protein-C C-terminal domain-containing protein n=2 Tax=Roseomonas haemaphysalidis TaxID=2768162 RepID=A0ABS3KK43_9PROT|nr:hypothetical protein [Roseomonas haemaphysalidis]
METQGFPRRTGCGLRKLTTGHLAAARLADQAPALPDGIRHPNQLLAAMRRAAPYLGQTRLLPLMEALFRWTQPQDWAAECDPVVWPSNEELAHTLACSERHVSRLLSSAIEAGLVVMRDSSDRRRRGMRRDGRIVWAWGISLRPMAARHADFVQVADAGAEHRRHCHELRRRASAARQFIAQLQALAASRGLVVETLETYGTEARQICATLRRMDDQPKLQALTDTLQAMAADARTALEQAVNDADMSGSPDSPVRSNLPTNERSEMRKELVAAREEAPSEPPSPSGNEAMAEGEARISPGELMHLAPRLRACMPPGRPAWPEIGQAATIVARQLGISSSLYGEACGLLGRRPAAIAIAVISTKPDSHFHTAGPGGYLRGMLRRASRGELNLDRSIHGLRDAAGSAHGGWLTAVNQRSSASTVAGRTAEMRYLPPKASSSASASMLHE